MKKIKLNSKFLHLKNCTIKRGGKSYPYYAIAESHFENGKNQKRIIKYLGPLSLDEANSFKLLLKSINSGKLDVLQLDNIQLESTKDFLNIYTLHSIWKNLGFKNIFPFSEKKDVQLGTVAEILTISKLLNPSCATKTVDWIDRTYLPEVLGIGNEQYNRMKIFNELDGISKNQEKIEKTLIDLSKKFNSGNFKIFFIDGTTTFFEGNQCEIAKPGDDKTTGYRSHTILILLVTDAKGYPVAWEVCEGNEKEIIKFQFLAKRICEEYGVKDFTFCFDRGFASLKNFKTLSGYSSHFISGIDKNQIAQVFDVDKFFLLRDSLIKYHDTYNIDPSKTKNLLPLNGFYSSNGEKFFKELGVTGAYRHVVGFSVEIFKAEQLRREKNQLMTLEEINELNEELSTAKADRDLDVTVRKVEKIIETHQMGKIIQYVLIPKSIKRKKNFIQTARIEITVDNKSYTDAGKLDGLFVYITDHIEKTNSGHFIVSAADIVIHYRNKYIIEKDFKQIKNNIELRPLFVRLENHVRAMVTITILAQFINVFIEDRLRKLEISSQKFLQQLSNCSSVAKLSGHGRKVIKQLPMPALIANALPLLGISNEECIKITANLV
jgi:transposase